MANQHSYTLDILWSGKTEDPRLFDRTFTLSAKGKQNIAGSSDPASGGTPSEWNPEEMLLGSLASCHMLWYLYLCAASKIIVTEYKDRPMGILTIEPKGKSRFIEASLTPSIIITDPDRTEDALFLQKKAHDKCYIANSLNFEVKITPRIQVRSAL